MLLDLEDGRIRVRTTLLRDGRRRLTIDYPAEPGYRDTIFTALADLLRPGKTTHTLRRHRHSRKEVA